MAVKLYSATSLDGYIATVDDNLQWLFDVVGEADNGTESFYAGIDVIVMGKNTYDYILNESPGHWAYGDKKVYVLSRSPYPDTEDVTFINSINQIPDFLDKRRASSSNIWLMGGGEINQLFLEAREVTQIILTVAPVLLGNGKALFPKGDFATKLKLIKSQVYGQFVELTYDVLN